MIPSWIIEEIRREERERQEREERRRLPLEAPQPYPYEETSPPTSDEPSERGVVIIEY